MNEELPTGLVERWWIHLVGPDDLIPAPDELTALRQANEFNVQMEKQRREYANDPNWPFMVAIVRKQ